MLTQQEATPRAKTQREIDFEEGLKQLEKERDELNEQIIQRRMQRSTDVSINYLDIYEDQIRQEKKLSRAFYEEEAAEHEEIDKSKPKLFQPKQQQAIPEEKVLPEDDFDETGKTLAEISKVFNVSEDKDQLNYMHDNVMQSIVFRLKDRQVKFFAFLNKEFNILNYKSARCSMHCFDDVGLSIGYVNRCIQACKTGIVDCK